VASFRSTLSEALEASLLLYVVDASDPMHEVQLGVTRDVLREIGADAVPSLVVLNKADRLDAAAKEGLARRHTTSAVSEGVVVLSAHSPDDVAGLRKTLLAFFEARMVEGDLLVPYAKQSLLGEVYENARVVAEEYGELGVAMRIRGLPAAVAKLARTFAG
jgi:GTP-binding protein HflX